MPAGIQDPIAGSIAFGVVKLVGYSFAAFVLSKVYQRVPSAWFKIGLTRTVIGFAFGYPLYNLLTGSPWFLVLLVPVRLMEWLLLLLLFYDRKLQNRSYALTSCVTGTTWSFLLDIPTIAGWLLVGGFWIC